MDELIEVLCDLVKYSNQDGWVVASFYESYCAALARASALLAFLPVASDA